MTCIYQQTTLGIIVLGHYNEMMSIDVTASHGM